MALTSQKKLDGRLSRILKHLLTKSEFESKIDKLIQKIGCLPTKDEFYNEMDKLMKELEVIREEKVITPTRSEFDDLEERVAKVEHQVFAS